MRNLQIPTLRLNELVTSSEEDGYINIWYGINDESLSASAVSRVRAESNKYKGCPNHKYDFSSNTSIDGIRWYIDNEFNVFENTGSTPESTIIQNNQSGYDKVYWLCIKLDDKKT